MKILHYSDQSTKDFQTLYDQCDILVTTGDLTLFDFPSLEDNPNKKPSFGVYGNHDSGEYLEKLDITNLHNKIVDFSGFKWGGFQSCLKYKEYGIFYTEGQAKEWADTFPYVDILLLHAGPLGILDDPTDSVHIGSENIARYVKEKQPKYIFCGHQYSDDFMEVGNTKIYRTFGARFIEII